MTNGEISERKTRELLARDGFKKLSLALLRSYISDGLLPEAVERNGRRYFRRADIDILIRRLNRPTPVPIVPVKNKNNSQPKLRRCFRNAGL